MIVFYTILAAALLFAFMVFAEVITYQRWVVGFKKAKKRTIYVDAYRGNDSSADPTKPETPLRTLKAAIVRANNGDRVDVTIYVDAIPASIEVSLHPHPMTKTG